MAHEFADLHDRSGRMKAKGVVRDILEWKSSREYFYWRVKRRLAENEVRKMFKAADPSQTHDETTKSMQVLHSYCAGCTFAVLLLHVVCNDV